MKEKGKEKRKEIRKYKIEYGELIYQTIVRL